MKMIDTHAHLDMEPLAAEAAAAIERAAKVGVGTIINVGASLRGSERSVALANSYPHIYAAVGLHPHEAETLMDLVGTVKKLGEMAEGDKVVAIGEIGLDYFDHETRGEISEELKEKQKELFVAQLKLAKDSKLPVIYHVRDAWNDFFAIIEEYKDIPGVVHCFTAGPAEVERCVAHGLYVGYTGIITFKNQSTDSIREAVVATPLDRILTETDAPFLAPEPHRGKVCEPAYVAEVAAKIAELKKTDVSDLAEKAVKNAQKLFNI